MLCIFILPFVTQNPSISFIDRPNQEYDVFLGKWQPLRWYSFTHIANVIATTLRYQSDIIRNFMVKCFIKHQMAAIIFKIQNNFQLNNELLQRITLV